MSFTFSHPAVVLPLLSLPKKWRSTTGLIVGSMAPDFEKFIRMSEYDPHSHTWWGIFYFNLPLGLLLSFAFHLVVRNPLIGNLPIFLRLRFQEYTGFNWWAFVRKKYGVVILSVLVGTFSHLALDKLTHSPGHREQLLPFVNLGTENLTKFISRQMVGLWPQSLTSLVGILVSGWFIWQLPKTEESSLTRRLVWYWPMVTVITLVGVGIKSQLGHGIKPDPYHPIIVLISAVLFSLILAPIVLKLSLYRKL